jgi:membrane associated rhomboid family serine protease
VTSSRQRLRELLDPRTWLGAMLVMLAVAAVLWAVQIANAADDYHLDRLGLKARRLDGLWGVVTQPLLHAGWGHLLSNTVPLVLIGWVVMRSGLRIWGIVTGFVVVVGGLATWLVGPSHQVVVGASGLVFGWLGYILARAYFARRLLWIFEAVAVLFFFGTLLYGLLPTLHAHLSWQSHVCGFLAGVLAGALLHPRGARAGAPGRAAVS